MKRKNTGKFDLDTVKEKVGALPPLPEAVTLVLRILDDPKSNASDITNIVIRDAGTASKILQLVNSAYFGLTNKVSDITHAITLLGFNEVRNMLLAVGTFGAMSLLAANKKDFRGMWKHSATCALLCRLIAGRLAGVPQDAAFAVGLFHDAGKLALMQYLPAQYRRISADAKLRSVSFLAAEPLVLDTDHTAIGQWMATDWELPAPVINAIGGHHDPEFARHDPLVTACHFANYICWLKGLDCPGSFGSRTLDLDLWKSFGLSSDNLDEFATKVDIEAELVDLILETSATKHRGR
jgi:HD-like signal output (HDOD) protein